MKLKHLYIAGIALTGATLTACSDFLDRRPDDQVTEDQVFNNYDRATGLVNDVWATARGMENPIVYFSHFGLAGCTDECEAQEGTEDDQCQKFNRGEWSSTNTNGNSWRDGYFAIRQLNVFLQGIQQYNTPDNPKNPGELQYRIGEAYFLRAYISFLLMKKYGEIVYNRDVYVPGDDMFAYRQESVHSVVEKIVEDATTAMEYVGGRYDKTNAQFGRCDQGACLGLIAAARYIAATPFYNGASDRYGYTDTRIYKDEYTYDASRWTAAAKAAKAVIDFSSGGKGYTLYQLYSEEDQYTGRGDRQLGKDATRDLRPSGWVDNGSPAGWDGEGQAPYNPHIYTRLANMFGADGSENYEMYDKEAVFFLTSWKPAAWQGDNYPPSLCNGGGARQQPVQEQVDEYECIVYRNGQPYGVSIFSDEARNTDMTSEQLTEWDRSGTHKVYEDEDPYVNRDPRFYRDIIFHGQHFRGTDSHYAKVMDISDNNQDGIKTGTTKGTHTGYYLRKFFMEDWQFNGGTNDWTVTHPQWRLPEFIYIYAEATTRANGTVSQEAFDMVNEVRARSFMAPMVPEAATDPDLFLEYIDREWRVELFYENKRFFRARLYLEPNSEQEQLRYADYQSVDPSEYYETFHQPLPKLQNMINGMRPVNDNNGKIIVNGQRYRMQRFQVETRVWRTQFYLWPIHRDEIRRAQGSLVQNPFWESEAGE